MTVYVDALRPHPWRGRVVLWCHMIADTVEELHEFAARVGCKREWFQADGRHPHYDLQSRLRARAVKLGAKECRRSEFGRIIRSARRAALEQEV